MTLESNQTSTLVSFVDNTIMVDKPTLTHIRNYVQE
jgi:hypothetical protein